MLCQRARQLLAPPRGPLSAIGGIDSLRLCVCVCHTTTSLTVTACHHLHHFFTLTHLTILPIAIVKDDDQHHLL